MDRTRFTAVQALKAAGLDWADLDRVLLVGGSTRMPMVREMLQQVSGKEPDASVAADEAVAHGAALRAGLVLAQQAGRPATFYIQQRQFAQPGRGGHRPADAAAAATASSFPATRRLPVTAKRIFKTSKADQRSILVQIVEGESPSADDCTPIGRCSVRHLPPDLPAKSPVEVWFHYQADGRLKVACAFPSTDRQVETEIVRENGLSKEHMDAWRQYICGLAADGVSVAVRGVEFRSHPRPRAAARGTIRRIMVAARNL